MAGEWRTLPARDFCGSVRDGTHDSPKPVSQGRYLVTSRHIVGGRVDLTNAYLISQDDFDAVNKRSKVDKWDVLVSMIGTVGEPCLVKEEPDFAIKNVGLFKSKGESEGKFLYYYLSSPKARQMIREQSRGTTQPYIPLEALRDFPIDVPTDPNEQRAIAHILGTLDDKIELNRRMNETLEAMAQALFKNWFVDFEPFRDQGMEDSPLGPIPKGWRVGILGDIADNQHRGIHPKDIDPSTPYIGLEHMPRKCIGLSEWGHAKELESNKFRFKKGEFLFGKLRPYFHKVGVAPLDGVCSTDILVIAPKEPACFGFALGHISSTEFVAYTDAGSTGTKMPRTNWQDMACYKIVIPPQPLAESFNEVICPLVDKIIGNIHQSHTLASIRDTLLPKLLSGEIRVKDAERFAEQAA